eukprot:TRINITY_DN18958_c0_g4_i1.p1 TRINITY_DN18958_c0_g4~~TRINITY_DN18958_c0_g4_i1.p1  ORF type:complete len:298 (+),score=30.57 TRINITY_DN18958_c0_g4_i1:134-1027(+)
MMASDKQLGAIAQWVTDQQTAVGKTAKQFLMEFNQRVFGKMKEQNLKPIFTVQDHPKAGGFVCELDFPLMLKGQILWYGATGEAKTKKGSENDASENAMDLIRRLLLQDVAPAPSDMDQISDKAGVGQQIQVVHPLQPYMQGSGIVPPMPVFQQQGRFAHSSQPVYVGAPTGTQKQFVQLVPTGRKREYKTIALDNSAAVPQQIRKRLKKPNKRAQQNNQHQLDTPADNIHGSSQAPVTLANNKVQNDTQDKDQDGMHQQASLVDRQLPTNLQNDNSIEGMELKLEEDCPSTNQESD